MTKAVKSVQFGVMGDADILAIATCKIDQPLMSVERNGVYDLRLGCTRNDTICPTCGENVWKCSGHFGYIDLATPIILFHKQVVCLLKCVCFECCRLIASERELRLHNITGFDRTISYLHTLSCCGHCKWPTSDIKYVAVDGTIVSTAKYKQQKIQKTIDPSFVKRIFDSLSDSDVKLLCLDEKVVHPRNYVLTKFPVLPTCCRPKMCAGENICDDDLTLMLVEILKANAYILSHEKSVDPQAYNKAVDIIRTRTLAYCDNSRGKVTHNTNHKPMTGIKERINCKTGLVRQNLMGKRCDRTARTVIGPDPTLTLDQVVVPKDIANVLTLPEIVTPMNIDRLTLLVNTGKASTIIKKAGVKINVHHARTVRGTKLSHSDVVIRGNQEIAVLDCKMQLMNYDKIRRSDMSVVDAVLPKNKHIELAVGDTVERYLTDGDPIYLNRQPTLHRNSMLGMRAVIKPGKTLRFNLAVTKELNADFDGDEGNMFCCESLQASAEMIHLVNAKEHMLSAQIPKPEHCFVQDSLLAAYLMTARPVPITVGTFEDILFRTNKYHLYKRDATRRLFTKDLFSYILPSDFFYNTKTLKIENGSIISGYFDKSSLGSTSNAIVKLLRMEYDKHVAADFIDNLQFITNAWLESTSFSIGFDDCMGNRMVLNDIKQNVQKFFIEAKVVSKSVANHEIREAKVNMALNKAKDLGLRIARDAMTNDNKIVDTVTSGSKGDFFNIAQITGLLGQQNLNNCRPTPTLTNNTRTLIHYPHVIFNSDQEYESRGFIQSSFLGGLNPKEMWFHAMTGREGMISTALKTASSGYIQRSCVKLNEDLKVAYDGTVRDAAGGIHQFSYGNMGFDPSVVSADLLPVDFDRVVYKLNNKSKESHLKLTDDEITSIIMRCSFRHPIPEEIKQSIWSKHEKKLRHELSKVKIASDMRHTFADIIVEKYITAQACPGECVGIIGAQSIGEVQTQSNLNTFHTAGKLQSVGIERFEELLKLTKTLKQSRMTIYFKNRFESSSQLRETIGSSIVYRELNDVIHDVESLDPENYKHRIRFRFKKDSLFEILLSPDKIMEAIESTFNGTECECEPMAIIVNVKRVMARSRSKAKKDESSLTIDEDKQRILEGNVDTIINDLKKCQLCGIVGIKAMYVDKNADGEFFVVTDGSNLKKMLAHPLVDIKRLYTNNVWETYECLGIAATKIMLLKDLKECVSNVNDCHVRLLAEKMTFKGRPSSITRYTMKTNNVGPLSKASFEQSVDIIQNAAFRGEIDKLNGVSASIIAGNHVRVGTGMMDLLVDWEKYDKNTPDVYY